MKNSCRRTCKTPAFRVGLRSCIFCGGYIAMAIDTDRIDDAVLALLHLTLHDRDRAGKGFDPDTLGRLHQKGMIDDPAGE